MFFRNLTLYRFADGVIGRDFDLDAALAKHPLREPGAFELSTRGFVSPFGAHSDVFTRSIDSNSFTLLTVGGWDRVLPSSVVHVELAKRVGAVAEKEGRRVGAKERRRLKDEVLSELIPRALSRPSRLNAYIDRARGWLVIDTSSRRAAEEVVSLIRDAIGRFPCTPPAPEQSPRTLLTDWLIHDTLPAPLAFGDECELRDPAEAGAVVRCRRQDLESDEVREHLKSGKQVFHLGFEFDERMSFTLGEDLVLRKLRFGDAVLDTLPQDPESAEAELDARFALMVLEIQRVLTFFADTFGIAALPALRLDGGDAPADMREVSTE